MKPTWILDFEGVIVDSEPQRYVTWKQAIHSLYGKNIPARTEKIARKINGRKSIENATYFLKIVGVEGRAEDVIVARKPFLSDMYKNPASIPPVKGLMELLDFIQGNEEQVSIGTSSMPETTHPMLDYLGIKNRFQDVVTAKGMPGKPNPAIYLKVAEKLGADTKHCIVIEDAFNGIQAARNANMKVIGITTTFSRKALEPKTDLVVDSLDEIIPAYKKLVKLCSET